MLRLLPRFKQSAGFASLHLMGDTAAGATRRKRVSLRMFVVRSNHQLYTTCSSNNTDWVIALFFAFSSNCSCNFCFALKQIFSLFSSIDFDATCGTLLGRIFFFRWRWWWLPMEQHFNQLTRRFNFTECLQTTPGTRNLCRICKLLRIWIYTMCPR